MIYFLLPDVLLFVAYNKNIAIAYKLGKIKVYETPKKLTELGLNHAPQSYVYL